MDILSMIRSWPIWAQFWFTISIATLGTHIFVKILDIFNNFISIIPIMMHGWPKNGKEEKLIKNDE
jgi:hypothetical protein